MDGKNTLRTIKFHADDSLQKLTEDTDNISRYLSHNTHIDKVLIY